MKYKHFFYLLIVLILIVSCAEAIDIQPIDPSEHVYGFWSGTWHGLIAGPAFILSLIWDDIAVYAVNNNGAWYDFGYVGGLFFIIKILTFNNDK
jgi:hypothetical protein